MHLLCSIEWLLAQASQTNISHSSSVSSPELDLLRSQIEFLQQSNADFGESFKVFTKSIYDLLIIVSIVLSLLGGFAIYIFNSTLRETTKIAQDIVERKVSRRISTLVDEEIALFTRSIDKERVIDLTRVIYLLEGANFEPEVCKLIRNRDFKSVIFANKSTEVNPQCEVLVLDFFNIDFSEAHKKKIIEKIISIYKESARKFSIVIYISSTPNKRLSAELQGLIDSNNIYFTPANNQITLMGRTVDAAQLAFALR